MDPRHAAGSQIISETITKDMNGFMDVFLSKYEAEMQAKKEKRLQQL